MGDPAPVSGAELARAARILAIRTRREATGIFAGNYTSAFRGGGMEFEESKPYVPGDDVRSLDWNAMARTGEPFVKRFREERDQLLLLALDVSASMAFGSVGRTKAETAAHAAALLAAAAGRAGDRIGLVTFDRTVRAQVPPARGAAHTWHLIRTALAGAESAEGETGLAAAADALLLHARHRSVAVVLSDFRATAATAADSEARGAASDLLTLARRHDVISVVLVDPREESLPAVGRIRVEDPEVPGRTLLLDTSSRRARARYARASAQRRRLLERSLRRAGSDVLWMRSDRDPLRVWMHYFQLRAARVRDAA